MFLIIILYANQFHNSNSKGTRRDFNDFGNLTAELITIIAHPLSVAEDVGILFTILQILIQVGIKARRAIFATLGVVLRTIRTVSTIIPTLISPAGTHITTIHKLGGKFFAIVVSCENTTQPIRSSIPVMIGREHRTVREFDTDATSCSYERFLKSTNVL
jgi:phage-related protein